MRFEWFVAGPLSAFSVPPRGVRLVTLFSIIGVAAGVATLVIALAMNTGFRETLQDRLLGVTAHISLTRPGLAEFAIIKASRQITDIPGVRFVTPGVYQTVLMSFGGESRGVVTKGIEPEWSSAAMKLCSALLRVELNFSPDKDGIDSVLIGKQFAQNWRLSAGRLRYIDESARPAHAFRHCLPRSRQLSDSGGF